ncbi:MAG: hypothetical protein WBG46_14160 [Nonlabens sp.]
MKSLPKFRILIFLALCMAGNHQAQAQRSGAEPAQADLVHGFSEILVELFKNEKFKLIANETAWLSTSQSTGEVTFKQKKKRQYVFVLAYHADRPVTPLITVSNEDKSQSTTLNDFFTPYTMNNHPLVPKKVKMLKSEFGSNVKGTFTFEIFNSSDAGYAEVMVFEKKM